MASGGVASVAGPVGRVAHCTLQGLVGEGSGATMGGGGRGFAFDLGGGRILGLGPP